MNAVYADTLISTLLADDELPNDYVKRPEEYFVSFSHHHVKKYTTSHLENSGAEYIPGVVLLRDGKTHILDFEHETADVISTWVELLALTRSCSEGSERLTFIFDSPYELSMDAKNDSFVLTIHDRSQAHGTTKNYAIHKSSFLQGILKGARVAHEFFHRVADRADLEELEDHIIFLEKLLSRTT